jgi:hypothetical protein
MRSHATRVDSYVLNNSILNMATRTGYETAVSASLSLSLTHTHTLWPSSGGCTRVADLRRARGRRENAEPRDSPRERRVPYMPRALQ